MKVAVVGATGMVGQVMLRVLEEEGLKISRLIPVASSKSIGKKILFQGEEITIIGMEEALLEHPDIAIFSAGRRSFFRLGTKICCLRNYCY